MSLLILKGLLILLIARSLISLLTFTRLHPRLVGVDTAVKLAASPNKLEPATPDKKPAQTTMLSFFMQKTPPTPAAPSPPSVPLAAVSAAPVDYEKLAVILRVNSLPAAIGCVLCCLTQLHSFELFFTNVSRIIFDLSLLKIHSTFSVKASTSRRSSALSGV